MNLTLKLTSKEYYKFLYQLLRERDPKENISHRKLPTYEEHCKFNARRPYQRDKILLDDNEPIGRFYVTHRKEIGIRLLKDVNKKQVLKEILGQLIPFPHIFYINIAPTDKLKIKLARKFGLKKIQETYAYIP